MKCRERRETTGDYRRRERWRRAHADNHQSVHFQDSVVEPQGSHIPRTPEGARGSEPNRRSSVLFQSSKSTKYRR
eukprot:8901745-Pyramimonas_sp.AAC.1